MHGSVDLARARRGLGIQSRKEAPDEVAGNGNTMASISRISKAINLHKGYALGKSGEQS